MTAEGKSVEVVEGDANLSAARAGWNRHGVSYGGGSLLERDAKAFFHQSLSTPCLDAIVGAEGPFIVDADGRKILDFHGNSVHQVGHGHPDVVAAVEAAMEQLPFSPRRFTNELAVELAERLVALAPGDLKDQSRVLLVPSGAVAVGLALRIARVVTGRHKTVAFTDSFHGATMEAASAGGQELFTRGLGPMLPGALHVQPPCADDCRQCATACTGDCAAQIELALSSGEVAAVIAEPVRATTAHIPPPEFWQRVRAACDRYGTLLIFDEIPTGLGRTGRLWACEHFGVSPDLLVLGKGLGGGVFPIAAVVGRSDLNDRGKTRLGELSLGHFTHEKSPVGSAAALATLELIISNDLPGRAEAVGHAWAEELRSSLASTDVVRAVRQLGLMVAIELCGDGAGDLADRCLYEMLRRGLSCKVGGGVNLVMFPPLNIDSSQLERATSIIIESIGAAQSV